MRRKITYLLLALSLSFSSMAAVIMVEVEDFEFNPSVFNVNVGDTIMWFWDDGFHTTTSTTIPAGASSWDSPITSTNPLFTYVVTVPGSYDFQCMPHASMGMMGHFTASVVTGVDEIPQQTFLNIKGNSSGANELTIAYGLTHKTNVTLLIYDILGNPVKVFPSNEKNAGLYEEKIPAEGIAQGIYIVELITPGSRLSKKVLLQ